MKKIGIIGGMSWQSTQEYRKFINEEVARRLGGLNSAEIIEFDVNFAHIDQLMRDNDWKTIAEIIVDLSRQVEAAGADLLVMASNTIHKVADDVSAAINIPLVHIGDATGQAIAHSQISNVGLLGTKATMEEDFLKGHLIDVYNLEVNIPSTNLREEIQRIIFDELCQGLTTDASKQVLLDAIEELTSQGSEGVILGCTELPLLVQPTDTPISLFDTTKLHSVTAVDMALV